MAWNTFKCNYLVPLHCKALTRSALVQTLSSCLQNLRNASTCTITAILLQCYVLIDLLLVFCCLCVCLELTYLSCLLEVGKWFIYASYFTFSAINGEIKNSIFCARTNFLCLSMGGLGMSTQLYSCIISLLCHYSTNKSLGWYRVQT